MKSLKSLLYAMAFLIGAALVIGALAYCVAHLIIGGAL